MSCINTYLGCERLVTWSPPARSPGHEGIERSIQQQQPPSLLTCSLQTPINQALYIYLPYHLLVQISHRPNPANPPHRQISKSSPIYKSSNSHPIFHQINNDTPANWPNGKALDYESRDRRFESCIGHFGCWEFDFLTFFLHRGWKSEGVGSGGRCYLSIWLRIEMFSRNICWDGGCCRSGGR